MPIWRKRWLEAGDRSTPTCAANVSSSTRWSQYLWARKRPAGVKIKMRNKSKKQTWQEYPLSLFNVLISTLWPFFGQIGHPMDPELFVEVFPASFIQSFTKFKQKLRCTHFVCWSKSIWFACLLWDEEKYWQNHHNSSLSLAFGLGPRAWSVF